MNAEIIIGAGCDAATAVEAESMLSLMPTFIGLDEQGYAPIYAEAEVSDVAKWTPEEVVAARNVIQERGLTKIQEFLDNNEHGSFKIDHGEHKLEDGAVMFWFIVSEGK